MPTTRSNLAQTPVNSDTLNWTGDLATLADSLEVIVPVANQGAGDTVASARATAGFAVSDARPLFIFNQATGTIQMKNASGWRDLNTPLGLINLSLTAATSVGLGGSAVLCDFAQVNLVAGRLYKATYRVNTVCAGSANMAINVAIKKDSVSTGTTGTDVDDSMTIYTAPVANQGKSDYTEFIWRAATTETCYLKALLTRAAGASLYDISVRKLGVYDLGKAF